MKKCELNQTWKVFCWIFIFNCSVLLIFGELSIKDKINACWEFRCIMKRVKDYYGFYFLLHLCFGAMYSFILKKFNIQKDWMYILLYMFMFSFCIFSLYKYYYGFRLYEPFFKWMLIVFFEYLYLFITYRFMIIIAIISYYIIPFVLKKFIKME